jgi:hypothetical protein
MLSLVPVNLAGWPRKQCRCHVHRGAATEFDGGAEYHAREMASGDRPASRTAILTAVARALHREEPPPWVLDDYLAAALVGDEGDEIRAELVAALPVANLLSFSR